MPRIKTPAKLKFPAMLEQQYQKFRQELLNTDAAAKRATKATGKLLSRNDAQLASKD